MLLAYCGEVTSKVQDDIRALDFGFDPAELLGIRVNAVENRAAILARSALIVVKLDGPVECKNVLELVEPQFEHADFVTWSSYCDYRILFKSGKSLFALTFSEDTLDIVTSTKHDFPADFMFCSGDPFTETNFGHIIILSSNEIRIYDEKDLRASPYVLPIPASTKIDGQPVWLNGFLYVLDSTGSVYFMQFHPPHKPVRNLEKVFEGDESSRFVSRNDVFIVSEKSVFGIRGRNIVPLFSGDGVFDVIEENVLLNDGTLHRFSDMEQRPNIEELARRAAALKKRGRLLQSREDALAERTMKVMESIERLEWFKNKLATLDDGPVRIMGKYQRHRIVEGIQSVLRSEAFRPFSAELKKEFGL
jgi:hypothetical protein